MNIQNKLLLRKLKLQVFQFLAVVVITAIGVAFFVTMKTVLFQYNTVAEEYYEDYKLADCTLYGNGFTAEDLLSIGKADGVKHATLRYVYEFRSGEASLRTISMDSNSDGINIPFIFSGKMPQTSNECMLLKKYAEANNLGLGDTIEVKTSFGKHSFKISALVCSPEYVYFAQSESIPMANPKDFGVMFVQKTFFQQHIKSGYNEILILLNENKVKEDFAKTVKSQLLQGKVTNIIMKDGQISYKMYKDDLKQIDTFAYIFPFIFLAIASLVIYVMQKRSIVMERRQIGIFKALGLSNANVFLFYTKHAIIVASIGTVLGCFLSILFGNYILKIFGYMFELPELHYVVYPGLWALALAITLLISLTANILGLINVFKIQPAEAMHAEKPRSGKRILLERIKPLWNSYSFNTRYALKSALRNKGRFMAVVLGMSASITLTIFALGFNNSFEYIIKNHYDNFIKYHATISIPITKTDIHNESLALPQVKEYEKALVLPVTVESKTVKKDYPLMVIENGFDMFDLRNSEGEEITLQEGVVLPIYVAEKLGVKKGDEVKILMSGESEFISLRISELVEQYSGFYVYVSYDFIKQKIDKPVDFYNVIFTKTDDLTALSRGLEKTDSILSYTTVKKDKETLLKLLETITVMINFLILFSVILGIAVLLAVGIINLTARSYEFVLLKVMGYSMKNIMLAQVKEMFVQILLALPIGFTLGNLLIHGIKDEFSNDSFVIKPFVFMESYIFSALLLLLICLIVMVYSYTYIKRLDIIEGLKAREE